MAKDTVIIIAVCAALAAAVALFLTVRVVRHCMRTSNPLPPPQPLAHHREQQLAKFENSLPRSQTWYQQNHIPAPRQFGSNSARASSVSLIPKTSPSLSAEDSLDYTHLPLPNPSFLPRPGSSSSYTSSETGHTRSTFTSNSSSAGLSSPPTPPLEQPIPRPHARSSSTPSRRSRPISTASSHSTIHSKTSRHTLRPGVPHGPHSQIQIVLPAPLSSDPYNQFQADYPSSLPVSRFDDGSYRKSVVDRWVSTGDLGESFVHFIEHLFLTMTHLIN